MFFFILSIFTLILILLIWYRFYYSPYQVFKRVGISHPPVTPFVGNVTQMTKKGVLEAIDEGIQKYGKVFGFYIGIGRWLIVADPDIVKEMFVKRFDQFPQRAMEPVLAVFARGEIPPGLIFMEGGPWKLIKPIVSPSFSSKKLKLMVPFIDRSCASLKERMSEICSSGHSADVFDIYGQFTMETVLGAAFGSQVNVLKGEGDSLTEAAAGILAEVDIRAILWSNLITSHFSWLIKVFLSIFGDFLGISVRRHYAALGEIGFELIKQRRELKDSTQNKDFLQLLMDAKAPEDDDTGSSRDKKTLTDEEIVGLCVDFLLAGYETTKNTMSYTSYLLSLNTEKQDLLCNAIDKYYQDNKDATLYDASQDIQYLDWVVQESLRMYPPVTRISRYCSETSVISGVTIPKGSCVQVPVRHLHHSPEYWEQPEEFIPERFSPEGKEGRHPLCYLPFGWGQRSCIGMRFAMMEIKMALVNVLREYKFERSAETQVPLHIKQGISQYPIDGVYLKVIKRN